MNQVLLEILATSLWIVAIFCGYVAAVLHVMNDYTSFDDRVGGIALVTGGLAYLLTCCRR